MLVKLENGVPAQWPLAEHYLQHAHPNTSFPQPLSNDVIAEFDYGIFQYSDPPTHNPLTQEVKEIAPALNSGVYVQAWEVVEKYSPEQAAEVIAQREAEQKAAAKAQKWEDIKRERDRRKAAGVAVGDKWFHSDDASRIQQLGLVMMGANIPADLQWKTMDGTFVTMTQALANQLLQVAAASDQAIFAKAEQHKAAMEASDNPLEYDFYQDADKTQWPVIYGE